MKNMRRFDERNDDVPFSYQLVMTTDCDRLLSVMEDIQTALTRSCGES